MTKSCKSDIIGVTQAGQPAEGSNFMSQKITLSPAEVAEALGVSRPMVYQLLHQEGFPAFKLGTRTLVSAEGLREWVAKQTGNGGIFQ